MPPCHLYEMQQQDLDATLPFLPQPQPSTPGWGGASCPFSSVHFWPACPSLPGLLPAASTAQHVARVASPRVKAACSVGWSGFLAQWAPACPCGHLLLLPALEACVTPAPSPEYVLCSAALLCQVHPRLSPSTGREPRPSGLPAVLAQGRSHAEPQGCPTKHEDSGAVLHPSGGGVK